KEEQQFELTLDQGMRILTDAISQLDEKEIPGEVVFKLYDTYGFPTDLTADIARERNLTLDMAGFDRAMEAQRERARAASQFGSADTGDLELSDVTEFVGYESLEDEATVIGIIVNGAKVAQANDDQGALVVLDKTAFYAESGGQAGDTGQLIADGVVFNVTDTVKSGDAFLHQAKPVSGRLSLGDKVKSVVDRPKRDATRLNHSATHLMHAALRKILGEHVNQRGSLVNAERLRFDFSHFEAVSKEQLREIERLVNTEIRNNSAIETEVMDLESAKGRGAMALFDEKYSAEVRVLTMGDGFSVELCGGTHATRTGDIGIFRVVSEQGVASGVRRIEAITGSAALAQVESNEDLLSQAGSLVRADNHNLADKLSGLIDQNKKLEKTIADLNRKLATGGVGPDITESAIDLGGVKLVVSQLDGADPKSLPDVLDQLKNKIGSGIIVLGTVSEGKVGLIVGVTKDLTDRFHAGNLVNHIASQVGGKGGGRPDMARAGGSDPDALPAALASVEQFARNLL
ncbi:MAG: alanine--tRNA ligase, partial [Gammaproteobacteria bacterium]|nr:alanine--tRNA ligase [Gammaproteobacteria bacterium]